MHADEQDMYRPEPNARTLIKDIL